MDINDITYAINGAVFEVNRVLGSGFLEKVYENALLIELKRRGLKAENQVPIRVLYKENAVGEYLADILVEKKVIVELKSVEKGAPVFKKQLLTHLRLADKRLGLLINFGQELLKDGIFRIVNKLDE